MNHRHAERVRPARGETVSGDATLVRAMDEATLLAVIDGLGHGPAAHLASQRAVETLRAAPSSLSLDALLSLCDRALRGTRGAALSLVRVRGLEVEAVGVGNVMVRARDVRDLAYVPMPGIVGSLRRNGRVTVGVAGPRARLVIASDGISSRFDLTQLDGLAPDAACEELVQRHGADHDDVSVIVCDLVMPA